MALSPNQKEVMVFFALLFLVSGMFLGFQQYQFLKVKQDYTGHLSALEQDLRTLRQQWSSDIVAVNKGLADQKAVLDQKIESVTTTNQGVIEQLTAVKTESEQSLLDLTSQLQNVESKNTEQLQDIVSRIGASQQDFSLVIENALPSVVSINTVRGKGSGIIISEDGYVVTNYHVVEETAHLSATTSNRQEHALRIVGVDPATDVAVLQFDDHSRQRKIEVRESGDVRAGERVFAIGNPLGLDFSVTEGIVSSSRRVGGGGITYIQSDISINPGNSGGPLIDSQGRMIGMNTLKVAGVDGLGFSLPSSMVISVAGRLIKEDKRTG